jgi:hypothetical protein
VSNPTSEALATLRTELAALASQAGAVIETPAPTKRFTTRRPRFDEERARSAGWLWEVTCGTRVWSVRTAEDDPDDLSCVYVVNPSTWPEGDTDALSLDAARSFAHALLAACERAEQARTEREAS